MRRLPVAAVSALLLSGIFVNARVKAPSTEGPTPVKAEKGLVLITNRLDVDFAAYKVTFIEIGADRCIPCRKMQPIMKEVAAEFADDVQVVFYDVWKDPAPGREYGIQLIPTQVFIDANGKEVDRHVGFFAKEELVAVLVKQGAKK
jgi:thiol-disulfide isomerase/thioredoxin